MRKRKRLWKQSIGFFLSVSVLLTAFPVHAGGFEAVSQKEADSNDFWLEEVMPEPEATKEAADERNTQDPGMEKFYLQEQNAAGSASILSYSAHSQQEAVNWAIAQIGKSIDVDGFPPDQPFQCVDLIKAYYGYLGNGAYAIGYANKYIDNPLPPGWVRVYGNYQPGDVAVWKANHSCSTCNTTENGHVGIITSADSVGFNAVSQNDLSQPYCTHKWFNISALACAIRPDFGVVNNPVGFLDAAEGKEGAVFVSGWAFDADDISYALGIHIYIGGPAGVGEFHGIGADQYRPDVDRAHGVGSYHGFARDIPTSLLGNQEVYVYAYNIGSGENQLIGKKTVTIKPKKEHNPVGFLDAAEGKEGAVFVSGWAFDADDISYALGIHIYIGGPAGVGEFHGIGADQYRPDVDRAHGVGSYHGFARDIPTLLLGNQEIYVYAYNIGIGENQLIGKKTVTIKPKKEHTHSYKNQITTQPGCTTTGLQTYTCPECGDSYTEKIAATGHKYTKTTQNPTCTTKGTVTATCSICKYSYIEKTLPATGHKYATTTVAAAIGKSGAITAFCEICKEKNVTTISAPETISLSKTESVYTGNQQKPGVIVKDEKGKSLKNGSDYTVSYPKDMKTVGVHAVTINFKGNYQGKTEISFIIQPKGTSLFVVTSQKNGLKLKWAKQDMQTTGYEIAYSTGSKFSKNTTKTITVEKNATITKTISRLKANQKYYVRIRTYKTVKVNGKSTKFYSTWSKVMMGKPKK